MNPADPLSDQIRKKIAQLKTDQKPYQPEPYPFVPALDPEIDKAAFSEHRRQYESLLDRLNETYITNPVFMHPEHLNELMEKLNRAATNSAPPVSSGIRGILKRKLRTLIRSLLLQELDVIPSLTIQTLNELNRGLREFADRQRDFNACLAHFGQSIVPVMDEKVRKPIESCKSLDEKFNTLLGENVTLLQQRMDVLFEGLDRRHTELVTWLKNTLSEFARIQVAFSELDRETRRALMAQDRKLSASTVTPSVSPVAQHATAPPPLDGYAYYEFERQNRGPEEAIRRSQADYLDMIALHHPVLDIGCGRGEFLELLRNQKIEARGIDLNSEMVDRCREKGLDVDRASAMDHLQRTPAGSIGAITAFQVIEHLSMQEADEFLSLAFNALKPGGILVLETINTSSVYALLQFYFRDPTHQMPRHPETYRFLMETHGFHDVKVTYRSTPTEVWPESALTLPAVGDRHLEEYLREIASRIDRLKTAVYADCDIVLTGSKAGDRADDRE